MKLKIIMTDTSPKWKKPSEVMRLIRKKKKVIVKKNPQHQASFRPRGADDTTKNSGARAQKRKNPFSCSPQQKVKRQITGGQELSNTEHSDLFDILDEQIQQTNALSEEGRLIREERIREFSANRTSPGPETSQLVNVTQESEAPTATEVVAIIKDTENCGENYPFEWSLRTKIRIMAKSTFAWCAPLKSKEETGGITSFVKSDFHDLPDLERKSEEFQKLCMYYTCPCLPWMKLFPRIATDNQISMGGPITSLADYVQKGIQENWCDSFTSVYNMLRNDHCKYFYVCTHQQTILFRRYEELGMGEIQAIITPTSRGFRETLKVEDIEFEMPLHPKNASDKENQEKACNDLPIAKKEEEKDVDENNQECKTQKNDGSDYEDEEDIARTNDGASTWLEELGLDKKKYRSLDPNQVRLQRDTFKLIDNRPESTVVVTGYDTHSLYNFLLNYRGCLANTGVQAGIPPTILSPAPFTGATLKSLKVKQGALRQQQEDGSVRKGYNIEILGPIMPHCYQKILALFKDTHAEFTAAFSVSEPTIPLNGAPVLPRGEGGSPRGKSADLPVVNNAVPATLGKEAIREIIYRDDKYHWSVY